MHQRQFLPFVDGGAPSIRSLAVSSHERIVTVATDRSVSLLRFDGAAYALQPLALGDVGDDTHVIAAAAIDRPGSPEDAAAVAIAVVQDEKLSLLIVSVADSKPRSAKREPMRFELSAAPTAMTSVRATSSAGELFAGVVLFCADAVLAFGFIVSASQDFLQECVRLSSEQFASFFPELAALAHPVLAMDQLLFPASDVSWIALGCADGFVRVLSGRVQDGCSCGPYATWEFQIDGPVTAISLFATESQHGAAISSERLQCNVLATCAVGHALVVEDVFGSAAKELLQGSDTFDSIFAGVAADVDLDGHVELLLGTDDQELLVYKRSAPVGGEDVAPTGREEAAVASDVEEVASVDAVDVDVPLDASGPEAPVANEEIEGTPVQPTGDAEAQVGAAEAAANWTLAPPPSQWRVEVFGAIYSLAWVDANRDGANELLVASSTGVFVFAPDARLVLAKLQALLAALA